MLLSELVWDIYYDKKKRVSKWEAGVCLPDVYNLKLLANVLRTSVDCLLDAENENSEKVVETIKVGGAIFELVEKPKTILAGKILYARNFPDIDCFHAAIDRQQTMRSRRFISCFPIVFYRFLIFS